MADKRAPRPETPDLQRDRAAFTAELSRRVSDLEGALVPLKFDGSNAKAREDVRRRVHALRSSANVLGFLALGRRLALAEDVLDRAARTGLGPQDHAELLGLFRGLSELVLHESREAAEKASGPVSVLVVGGAELARTADALGHEVEHCPDPQRAPALARALAPDVLLLDADAPGARPFCDAIGDDALLRDLPVVVAGTFQSPEASAAFLARGAARVLAKPVSTETLRAALAGVSSPHDPTVAAPLGDVTPLELANRLAEEVRRALVDDATPETRLMRVPMGDGHDVLSSLWTSLARVREVVTARSRGAVRFDHGGPAGSLLLSTFDDDPRTARPRTRSAVSLEGRTVLVVDDDPAVTWFFAGIFRAAGCKVLEAQDGEQALGMLWRSPVDLLVSDVVMPGVDGTALSFAVKRDVVLHDVPVLLVSWREDLLARVRELGTEADGWLLKDASAGVVLARAAEVLRPRVAVEARLREGKETRGRVDGLSTGTLLRLVAQISEDAKLVVRDGVFQFEIDVRGGAPVRATRVGKGESVHGERALSGLLGVTSGRFVATRDESVVTPNLTGSLRDQVSPLASRARAAMRLLSASNLFSVGRVELDRASFDAYQGASPDTLRTISEKLASGVSPRELALRGSVPVSVIEAILGAEARRGSVLRVLDAFGEDLLAPRAEREAALAASARGESPLPRLDPDSLSALTPSPLAELPGLALSSASSAPSVEARAEETGSLTPLELPTRPGHVDFGRLVDDVPAVHPPDVDAPTELSESDEIRDLPLAAALPATVEDEEPAFPLVNAKGGGSVFPPARTETFDREAAASQDASPMPEPVQLDVDDDRKPEKPKKRGLGILALFGGVLAVGGGVFLARSEAPRASTGGAPPVASPEAAPVAPPVAPPVTPPHTPPAAASAEVAPPYDDLPLPEGETTKDGEGMIEIVAGKRDEVSVDKRALGKGTVRTRVAAGVHEVRSKRVGEEQPMVVHVKPGRLARVDLRAPWRR